MSLRSSANSSGALAAIGLLLLGSHLGCFPGDVNDLSEGARVSSASGGTRPDASTSGGVTTDAAAGGRSSAGTSASGNGGSDGGNGGSNAGGNDGVNAAGAGGRDLDGGGGNTGGSGGTYAGGSGGASANGGASTGGIGEGGAGGHAGSGGTSIASGGTAAGSGGAKPSSGGTSSGTGGTTTTGSGGKTSGSGGAGTGGGSSTGGTLGSGGTTAASCSAASMNCPAPQLCNAGFCAAPQGVVALGVPLTSSNQDMRYADKWSSVPNLANTTVTVRLYAPGATGGSLVFYLTDSNFTAGPTTTVQFSSIKSGWKDVTFNVGGASGGFNPAQTNQLTIEVLSGSSGPWTNPSVIYIDSVRSGNGAVADTFDSDLGGMIKSTSQVVSGSTLTWYDSLP